MRINNKVATVAIAAGALAIGGLVGTVVSKTVISKNPRLEGVLIWASGALVGAGAVLLVAPSTIDKSQAASILASGD